MADYKIRVNGITSSSQPPVYHGVFGGKEEAEKALGGFNDFHPIGELEPQDISNSILFLLSDSIVVKVLFGTQTVELWPEEINCNNKRL